MNEQIRLLADQAGIRTNLDTAYFEKDIDKWIDYYSVKFAELIIEECVSLALAQMYTDEEISTEDDPLMVKLNLACNVGVESAVESIKEHFGVEKDDEVEYCPKCNAEWSGTSCGLNDCGWIVGVEE